MEVDIVVVSVLTLAVLLIDRFAACATCLLVVGFLVVTARSHSFLYCASHTAILYLLVLAPEDIVT